MVPLPLLEDGFPEYNLLVSPCHFPPFLFSFITYNLRRLTNHLHNNSTPITQSLKLALSIRTIVLMLVTRVSSSAFPRHSALQLSKAVASLSLYQSHGASTPFNFYLNGPSYSCRQFSSTPRTSLRDYFPEPEHDGKVYKTLPAWEHPQ